MTTEREHADELVLSDADRNSRAWVKIAEHLKGRLESYRTRLEAMSLTHEDSIKLRARCAELRNLLAAGDSD